MTKVRKIKIGVLGPHKTSAAERELGRQVGAAIAEADALLLCGGMGGMMAAAAEGAKSAGGETLGILPGDDPSEANDYIDIALPTGLGPFRNALLVRNCDCAIAVHGAYGTLSEIAFALRLKVPVVGLETWSVMREGVVDESIHTAQNPAAAVEMALSLARGKSPSAHNGERLGRPV